MAGIPVATRDIAIVGAGLMGRWHAATSHRLGARIVAVVDANPVRAHALAHKFDALALLSVEEMLERVRPQTAHVCTPLATHVASTELLLDAGCHVLCEKPLAADASNVARLLDHAAGAGRLLCPVHQFAFQRGVSNLLARRHELGAICSVDFTVHSAGGTGLQASALDELVLDIVPHAFSVLARVFPKSALNDIAWSTLRPAAGELRAIGMLGQAVVSLAFSMSARPTTAAATIAGTRASAHLDFFHGYSTIIDGSVSRLRKATRPLISASASLTAAAGNLARRAVRREFAYPGLRDLCLAFYESVAAQSPPPFSAAEILDIYRARDRLAAQTYAGRHKHALTA